MRVVRLLLTLLVFFMAASVGAAPSLIPMPSSVVWRQSSFPISGNTIVQGEGGAAATAAYLATSIGLVRGKNGGSRIRLLIVPDRNLPGEESYHLSVTSREIRIEASHTAGLFYGAQTLRQLIATEPGGARVVPAVDISDAPRFRWRGLLIDLGRHFFGKPTLFKIIDEMAAYKLNVLHLHLTDDPGWRFEVAGYPKLTANEV